MAVKRTDDAGSGNPKLVELGGRWLADLDDDALTLGTDAEDSEQASHASPAAVGESVGDGGMALATTEQVGNSSRSGSNRTAAMDAQGLETGQDGESGTVDLAEALYRHVRSLMFDFCAEPKEGKAIADALGVSKRTVDPWLTRLVEERVLEKRLRPVRYVTREKDLLG